MSISYTSSLYYKQGEIWVHKYGLGMWYFASLTKPCDTLTKSLGIVSLYIHYTKSRTKDKIFQKGECQWCPLLKFWDAFDSSGLETTSVSFQTFKSVKRKKVFLCIFLAKVFSLGGTILIICLSSPHFTWKRCKILDPFSGIVSEFNKWL